MDEYHDELMNLSSSDISDSDETSLSRKSTQSNYSIDVNLLIYKMICREWIDWHQTRLEMSLVV